MFPAACDHVHGMRLADRRNDQVVAWPVTVLVFRLTRLFFVFGLHKRMNERTAPMIIQSRIESSSQGGGGGFPIWISFTVCARRELKQSEGSATSHRDHSNCFSNNDNDNSWPSLPSAWRPKAQSPSLLLLARLLSLSFVRQQQRRRRRRRRLRGEDEGTTTSCALRRPPLLPLVPRPRNQSCLMIVVLVARCRRCSVVSCVTICAQANNFGVHLTLS